MAHYFSLVRITIFVFLLPLFVHVLPLSHVNMYIVKQTAGNQLGMRLFVTWLEFENQLIEPDIKTERLPVKNSAIRPKEHGLSTLKKYFRMRNFLCKYLR